MENNKNYALGHVVFGITNAKEYPWKVYLPEGRVVEGVSKDLKDAHSSIVGILGEYGLGFILYK